MVLMDTQRAPVNLGGRPTDDEIRAELRARLADGGLDFVEADPDGRNKRFLVNQTRLKLLRELDVEGLIEVQKVALALDDRVRLRAFLRDREAEEGELRYDRFSAPRSHRTTVSKVTR